MPAAAAAREGRPPSRAARNGRDTAPPPPRPHTGPGGASVPGVDSVEAAGNARTSTVGAQEHAWARVLWDFHTAPATDDGQGAPKGDIVLALGSHDVRVAHHAARLWRRGATPLVVFSGDRGRRTGGGDGHRRWARSEAEVFAEASGLPPEAVLLEDRATNTGQNFSCARRLCEERGIGVRTAVATAKPYMARRALASAAVHWPGVTWAFNAFSGGYEGYTDDEHRPEELIAFLVGDLQRLAVYAERGWSAPVEVPPQVREAYAALVDAGFTAHLVPSAPTLPW